MKKIKNALIEWLIPPGIIKLVRTFNKQGNYRFEENSILKEMFIGETCYVISCGPSLNNFDLSNLIGKKCISVSNSFVHPYFEKINSVFHVFAERHNPITIDQYNAWFSDCKAKANPSTKILVSANDFTQAETIFTENLVYRYQSGNGDYPIDFVQNIPSYNTVVHIALYLAEYLGFSTIYLLGVDHDQILNFGRSNHFYKEEDSELVKNGYDEWSYVDLQYEFQSYATMWSIYRRIKENSRAKIYNLNLDSLLNIFEKKLLSDLSDY